MFHYGIYTRKSDDDRSVTEKSIGEQVSECTRLAERDGLLVFKRWEESRSARVPHRRAGYKELIEAVESGKIQGIVCWHINRLVRNMEEGGKLVQLFVDGQIKELRTPSAVYRTGDNILPLVIEAASATQFSLDHGKAVERGMNGSFRAGGCTNKAPQGYRNSRDPLNLKKGLVERDPDRFDTVRRGWEMLLTGNFTVRQVTNTMNQTWGFRTRPTKRAGNRQLSYSGAFCLFTNPFYAGFVHRKGELVKGIHEAMITVDEFESVQQIISRSSFSAPRIQEFAYTGLMRCVHCGQQITAELKRLRDGRLWENYHCSDARLKCTKLGLSLKRVEEAISRELDSVRIEPHLVDVAAENIRSSLGSAIPESDDILASQGAKLKAIDARLKRLTDMWLDGILVDSERYKVMEQLELAQKRQIMMDMERIRDERQRIQINLDRATRFICSAADVLPTATAKEKKVICRALGTAYEFDGRQKTISVVIHPLLKELVSYAQKIARLEPPKSGSHKQKEPSSSKAVPFGGQSRCGLEPHSRLVGALKGELFPDLGD